MPEGLWESAVSLAREHGAYWVATELGLSYQSLRRRTEEAAGRGGKAAQAAVQFVELEVDPLPGAEHHGATQVEVERADGARLRIRIGAGQPVDVARVAAAFAGDPR